MGLEISVSLTERPQFVVAATKGLLLWYNFPAMVFH